MIMINILCRYCVDIAHAGVDAMSRDVLVPLFIVGGTTCPGVQVCRCPRHYILPRAAVHFRPEYTGLQSAPGTVSCLTAITLHSEFIHCTI